jgi:hypothetical protein
MSRARGAPEAVALPDERTSDESAMHYSDIQLQIFVFPASETSPIERSYVTKMFPHTSEVIDAMVPLPFGNVADRCSTNCSRTYAARPVSEVDAALFH